MEDYTAQEIAGMLKISPTLSRIEAYAFGFMTGFVSKQNANGLLVRILALRFESSQNLPSMEKFNTFTKLLYDMRHIQASEIDILATYFQEIERRIEKEFSLLSKVQLFYFGRFHSLYNEADINKHMSEANQQNQTIRDNNEYSSEKEILQGIKKDLEKDFNLQSPSLRNLQKLTNTQVKIETKPGDQNQSEPSQYSKTQITMEVETPNLGQDQKPVPESIPQALKERRVAKKTSKNPPKKPESPIQHPEPSNFQGPSMLAPTDSFSLGLLAETIKLNTQMQSQYNVNTNQFAQFFAPNNSNPLNTVMIEKTAQSTVIDLEEGDIIFEEKISHNQENVNTGIVPSQMPPKSIEDVNKTPQKVQIDSLESKNITKVVLGALLSNIKKSNTDQSSSKSAKSSSKSKLKKEKPNLQKNFTEAPFEPQEEEKTSQIQIILNAMNRDDIYDLSYCSSDDVSYMSSPRSHKGPKELVLSYKSDNELDEDRELSFNENINVSCQS